MNYSNYSFTLNLQIHQSQISIPVSLNDTARKLYITFIDGRKPYTIPDGCRAVFVGFKSDETTLFNDCIIQENKTVIYEFTEQTANVEGVVNCEIRLYGEDGKQLTSSQFVMIVDENDTRDISLSENESTAIDNIIHAEIGRVEAENEREAAEKSRKELADFLATSGGVIVSDEEPQEGLANVWVDDSPEKEEIRLLDSTDIVQELTDDDEKIPSVALLKKSLDEFETGASGNDGLTPYIKDGNWWIGETDTGVKAEGKDGKDGINGKDGENGKDGTNGVDGADGKNGVDGKNGIDGKTPYIQDGYWYIDGVNLNVKAQGENGKDGPQGIQGPQGEQGIQGVQGIQGEKGDKGDKGDAGADGKAGVDGISATHSWNGTTLTITSASGTSSANLKGDKGDTGDKGDNYTLTTTDKTEIAEQAFETEVGQKVVKDIEKINETLSPLQQGSINIFSGELIKGMRPNANGASQITQIINNDSWCSKQVWKCKKGDVIRSNIKWTLSYLIYDANGVLITNSYFSGDYTVVNENAAQFTIQWINASDANPSKLMITLNNPMPSSYTPYVDNPTIDDIGANKLAIKDLQNGLPYFRKPFVVISYDAFNLTDNRFNITNNEYGFKATIGHKTVADVEINKTVMKAGWDIGLYQFTGSPALVEGQYDAAVSENPTPEILAAWEAYVKTAVDDAAEALAFNPTVWLTQQGCSCYGLEQALKKYGIPMCRGSYNPTYSNDWEYSSTELPTMTVAVKQTIMPSTIDACLQNVDEAVANGTGIGFLTHGIYATDEDANSHYGVTEAVLRTLFNKIKGYVDEGKLEVLTYREVYEKYYKHAAYERDYNRLIQMTLAQ